MPTVIISHLARCVKRYFHAFLTRGRLPGVFLPLLMEFSPFFTLYGFAVDMIE